MTDDGQRSDVPMVGWSRPVSARLHKEGEGHRVEDWIIVDFGLGAGGTLYDTDGLLAHFVGLHDAPPKRILAFARRFGLLLDSRRWRQFPPEGGDSWGMEVSVFRRYASLLNATLRLQRCLQVGGQVEPGDVETVRKFLRNHGLDGDRYREARLGPNIGNIRRARHQEEELRLTSRGKWVALQRARVVGVINWWYESGNVHPRVVVFPSGRLAVRWTGGLWGGLGGQLLYAIRREGRIAVCDYCHREFRLSRRPRTGAQARCCNKETCKREYRRHRMQQTRARQRDAVE